MNRLSMLAQPRLLIPRLIERYSARASSVRSSRVLSGVRSNSPVIHALVPIRHHSNPHSLQHALQTSHQINRPPLSIRRSRALANAHEVPEDRAIALAVQFAVCEDGIFGCEEGSVGRVVGVGGALAYFVQ